MYGSGVLLRSAVLFYQRHLCVSGMLLDYNFNCIHICL